MNEALVRALVVASALGLVPGRLVAQEMPPPPAGAEPNEQTAAPPPPPVAAEPNEQTVAPPPPPSAATETRAAATLEVGADDDYALSATELAELGITNEGGEAAAVDTSLKVNGFVDFGMSFVLFDDEWRRALQAHPAFAIGNFNLYVSKNLSDTVRMFSEVRFLYLPNGQVDLASGTVTSTVVQDYSDFQRPLKWGGIEIERIYLEWSMTPWLALRVGQFLTPYGIWNVDHGSPTVIPVSRPYVIGLALFPERQTGLELRGRVALSAQHALGYHLTLSNGIGPASEYRDFDDNKAVGARAYWSYEGLGRLTVGVSGFLGTNADARIEASLDENGNIDYGERITSQADVLALAADIQWTYDALLIQAEFMSTQTAYTADGRPVLTHPLTGRRMALQDSIGFGGYALVGYRFDWLGVMPFLAFNHVNYIEDQLQSQPRPYVFDAGLNIRPIESVVIKVQYQFLHFPGGFVISDEPEASVLFFQLAWAF